MSVFSRFFGSRMPSLPEEGPILAIDYAMPHALGIRMHGTLFLEGGKASSKWSTTFNGKRNTQPFEIMPVLFRSFWRAMDYLPEFKKWWVPDLSAKPEISKHHITTRGLDANGD